MASGKKKKGKMPFLNKLLIIVSVMLVLVIGLVIVYFMNQITEVAVEGNSYYTKEQIEEIIIDGELERNAWYLYAKYNYFDTPQIPFVDKIEVEVTGRGSVRITVYEKAAIAYVEYLGSFMYFDKDGIVVESTAEQRTDIPKIIGLEFDSIVLHEKLPVEKAEVFDYILNLTKELKKNDIMPDKIQFNDEMEATLHFDKARVFLGKDENQNEKITRLKSVIEQLKGKSGVLHMEEVDEEHKNLIFKTDGES